MTGSTHDVTVTDDFDEGFRDLAISRHGIADAKPDDFKYDEVRRHTLTEEDIKKMEEPIEQPLIQF